MRERAVTFGPERSLVGVWHPGSGERAAPFALVMVNPGVIHSAGMWRLHVEMARAAGDLGIPSLRFDLSGVGDSLARASSATLEDLILQDIDDALDVVRAQTGSRGAVVMGLCSGAADALNAALAFPDVRGIVCIDLIADFQTWRHHVVHYGRRLLRLESWINTVAGRNRVVRRAVRLLTGGRSATSEDGVEISMAAPGLRPVVPRDALAAELSRILDDGRRALLVFTGGLSNNYNHRSQFRAVLPSVARHPSLSLRYFGEADHTFTAPEQRARLVDTVTSWLDEVSTAGVIPREHAPGRHPPASRSPHP